MPKITYKKSSRTTNWRREKRAKLNAELAAEDETIDFGEEDARLREYYEGISTDFGAEMENSDGAVDHTANNIHSDDEIGYGQETDDSLSSNHDEEMEDVQYEDLEDSDDFFDAEDDFPDEEFLRKDLEDCKIFEGSDLSVFHSCIMLISLFLQYNISYACMDSFIRLLHLHLPDKNKAIKSLHSLFSYFNFCKSEFTKVKCCNTCGKLLSTSSCSRCPKAKVSSFLTFSLEDQVKCLFKREDFVYDLTSRFHKFKRNDSIACATDGALSQKVQCLFKSVYDFTMMLYTDGIQLFRSNKLSFWPILFVVNELPYNKRYLPQNVVFGGLWYSPDKPNFKAFMEPLVPSFLNLKSGLEVVLPTGIPATVSGFLINCTGDLPAKALLLNMTNFNGFFSCVKCHIKGETYKLDGNKKTFCFKYDDSAKLRTHIETVQLCKKAELCGKAVNGFKGESVFGKLVPDIIDGTGIDEMHGVFGGVCKKLVNLFFDVKYKDFPFSLRSELHHVDGRLTGIKPANFLNRRPRSLETCLHSFKTSEFKHWMYYYSIPVLSGLMKAEYLTHYFLLVHAMFLLNQNVVLLNDIDIASMQLMKFVKLFQSLYGPQFMSANVHALLHKGESVRSLGPGFETSCFPLEGLMGVMKRLVTGTKCPQIKIANVFKMLQCISLPVESLRRDCKAKQFVDSLHNRVKITEEVDGDTYVLGALKPLNSISLYLYSAVKELVETKIVPGVTKVWSFDRLRKGKFTVVAESYGNSPHFNSSLIMLRDSSLGIVEKFIKFRLCPCRSKCLCGSKYYAIVRKCERKPVGGVPDNIFICQVVAYPSSFGITVHDIFDLCVLCVVENQMFCVKRVNSSEIE
ncbi:uncharacterized protein LOC124165226 isoform X2 [Ischnura elegans]|uniref:uncharacterized protein LOC124165226 isoform X2 n=1 Tax=Ischnura elegans TaxID=197161 RepID=UPI001ED88202|nr:uncharacterized protein LOC124165226 isoform X2 [Ischnura elegans]